MLRYAVTRTALSSSPLTQVHTSHPDQDLELDIPTLPDMPKDLSKTSDGSYKTTCQEELKKLANTLLIGTNGQDARELVSHYSSTCVYPGIRLKGHFWFRKSCSLQLTEGRTLAKERSTLSQC